MLRSKVISANNDVFAISLKKLETEKIKVVMLALRNYKKYYFELNLLRETLYREYGIPQEISFEKLICWEPAMESLQSKIISIRNIHAFLETLKDAIERLDRFSKKGREIYYIMKESYLNEHGKTMVQISNDLSVSEMTCYRYKNLGFKLLSQYLWDVPIEVNRDTNTYMSFYELFKEVCYG